MGEEVSEYRSIGVSGCRGVGVGEFGDSGFVNSKMPVPGSGRLPSRPRGLARERAGGGFGVR